MRVGRALGGVTVVVVGRRRGFLRVRVVLVVVLALVLLVLALVRVVPVLVGVTVMGIGMAFGVNAGYAINPARDFGPRLFTALAGWGPGVFTAANSYFWVPIIAPCVGAVLGGTLYDLCITQRRQA